MKSSYTPRKDRKPRLNRAREERISLEIVVDAYGSDEVALSWYYYLEGKLGFPFKARCITPRVVSPLAKGEQVEVIGMAPEDDCMSAMLVLIRFSGRTLGVPLLQFDVVEGDAATRETMEDWRYWVGMGYRFQ